MMNNWKYLGRMSLRKQNNKLKMEDCLLMEKSGPVSPVEPTANWHWANGDMKFYLWEKNWVLGHTCMSTWVISSEVPWYLEVRGRTSCKTWYEVIPVCRPGLSRQRCPVIWRCEVVPPAKFWYEVIPVCRPGLSRQRCPDIWRCKVVPPAKFGMRSYLCVDLGYLVRGALIFGGARSYLLQNFGMRSYLYVDLGYLVRGALIFGGARSYLLQNLVWGHTCMSTWVISSEVPCNLEVRGRISCKHLVWGHTCMSTWVISSEVPCNLEVQGRTSCKIWYEVIPACRPGCPEIWYELLPSQR